MPRGGKRSQKGRTRHFTSAEELERQQSEIKDWREKKEEDISEDSDEDDSDEDESNRSKGVAGIIETSNPNREVKKTQKADNIDITEAKPELSRREREAIEKEEARLRYERLHAQGKTDEARQDLARLAIIKKQREEAAKKREEERKAKEDATSAASAAGKAATQAQADGKPSSKAARRKKK